jgi:N-acyl homoserine lactone hydrolase
MNRLSVLRVGSSRADKGSILVPEVGAGTWVVTPVYAYVIEQPDGTRVLVDSGLSPLHIEDPNHLLDEDFAKVLTPIMREEDTLVSRLASLGLAPADIGSVIATHLHFDHAGNHQLFAGVPIFVQREHYEVALDNPEFPNVQWNLPELRYELLDGEQELFPGVQLIVTPGHAPGHQSLLVSLASGRKVLLTIDAIFSAENVARDSWSSQGAPDTARESAKRLMQIADEHEAMVIYGHDHIQKDELSYAPHWYE